MFKNSWPYITIVTFISDWRAILMPKPPFLSQTQQSPVCSSWHSCFSNYLILSPQSRFSCLLAVATFNFLMNILFFSSTFSVTGNLHTIHCYPGPHGNTDTICEYPLIFSTVRELKSCSGRCYSGTHGIRTQIGSIPWLSRQCGNLSRKLVGQKTDEDRY